MFYNLVGILQNISISVVPQHTDIGDSMCTIKSLLRLAHALSLGKLIGALELTYQTSVYGCQTVKEPESQINQTQKKNFNIEIIPDKNWSKGIAVGWLALVH